MELKVVNASCGYDGKAVLQNVSLSLRQGEIVCILGPNGIGKTTVFRSVLGFLKLIDGEILLDGVPKEKISQRDFSRAVGYVPQGHEPPFPYTVPDVVVMGRAAHLKSFEAPGIHEYRIADRVMALLGISYLREKIYTQISGGERQMVLIARALAQNPKLLVMDEPTANLDYGNSFRVMQRVQELGAGGYTVIFSTHEPNQAFRYATRVLALLDGGVLADGPPDTALTEELLRRLYGVGVAVRSTEVEGERFRLSIPYEKGAK